MIRFNNLEEMKPFYNVETNTYEFIENDEWLDVEFTFYLCVDANITARNIKALNIDAWDIDAWDIDAGDIEFYAVCFAYESFKCKSVKGTRENAKYFCLDNEIEFI